MYEKIVVITRKTRLEELIDRFNTRAQARFYIESSGGNFLEYESEHDTYIRALDAVRKNIGFCGLKSHFIDRSYLPTYLFIQSDLIVALGQDGLVANTAKYVGEQPILGVNPDPLRYDGILVPLELHDLRHQIELTMNGSCTISPVTLAEAALNDGQKLLAFNDLYIGVKSHTSARYKINFGTKSETQSSSGIIVSTGAGSTGWMSSIFNMVRSINCAFGSQETVEPRMAWHAESLMFVVREPFSSKHSKANIVFGNIENKLHLIVESQIPEGGTIFSDGVESDFLQFNSGTTATIGIANKKAHLVIPKTPKPPKNSKNSLTEHESRSISYAHKSNQRPPYFAQGSL